MEGGIFSLKGRRALITGSSRGIGLAIAEGLAEAGTSLVLNGRDGAALAEAVAGLAQRGHAVRVDAAGAHFFGGAQCAWRTEADDAWIAASDPRRDGQAAGT